VHNKKSESEIFRALCFGLKFNLLFLVIFREELHSLVQSYLDFSLLGLADVINTKVLN